jgi:alpha-methylacyl-CoA racemase
VKRPLAGVTVLDLTTVGPGARCAAMLADLGATIVRVGPPASANRIVPEAWAYSGGRGVRRIGIDLKDPRGRDACLALAAGADVVLEGFRPGVAERLGIGPDDVAATNPSVVYTRLTGYGQDGAYAAWAGHDLNYQAVTGALAAAGRDADGLPALPGATFADSAGGGMHAALSICAALVRRASTGEGAVLDVAAVDGMLSLMSLSLDESLATNRQVEPGSTLLSGRYACYGIYRCGDGRFISVAAIEPKFWANLCRALDCEQWIDHQHDDAVQDRVRADLAAAFATRDRDDWAADLGPADTCVAPVLDIDEVPADPHLWGRFTDATIGDQQVRQTGRVLAGSQPESHEVGSPPDASDAADLLRAAGMTNDVIAGLIDDEVVS